MLKNDKIMMLVKPTHDCNLKCTYCYDAYACNEHVRMSFDTVKKIAEMAKNTAHEINWVWHGGEALLMGEEWFRAAHQIIRSIITDEYDLIFSIQTNGVLLERSLPFLKDLNINIGASYDIINDNKNRIGCSYDKENLKKVLRENNLGVINVIDYESSFKLIETYEKIKNGEAGLNEATFNFIFQFDKDTKVFGDIDIYIQNIKDYLSYVFFDCNPNPNQYIERTSIQYFSIVMGITNNLTCNNTNCMYKWVGIDPDGSLSPCDRKWPDKYKFGSIDDLNFSFLEMYASDKYDCMNSEYMDRMVKCKKSCEAFAFCHGGGCIANRVVKHGTIDKINEEYCKLRKELYLHSFNLIKNLSKEDMNNLNPLFFKKIWEYGYLSLDSINGSIVDARGV